MSRFVYTSEQLNFLAETFKECSLEDTTSMFNFVFGTAKTQTEIRACIKNNGFTCGRQPGNSKGQLRLFNQPQREWIERKYQELPICELTPLFNAEFATAMTEAQIRAFINNHGIKSGRTGQFAKGAPLGMPASRGTTRAGDQPLPASRKGMCRLTIARLAASGSLLMGISRSRSPSRPAGISNIGWYGSASTAPSRRVM